jgi:hypothetical protein
MDMYPVHDHVTSTHTNHGLETAAMQTTRTHNVRIGGSSFNPTTIKPEVIQANNNHGNHELQ